MRFTVINRAGPKLLLPCLTTIVLYFLTFGVNQNYPTEDLIQRNSTPQCIPAKNIGFLKIHKAASTSIQNIILRKSLRENLNVVMPKRGQNQLLDPHGMFTPFNSSWLNSQTPWHKTFMRENAYNVMALHCKWNHQSISDMLRKPTKFVTMIRDPADTFESHYLFYDQQKYTKMNLTMYLKRLDSDKKYRKSQSGALNSQLTDLGIKSQDLRDEQKIREKVKGVDDQFDLVMLADQFDESLILLAEKLCWKLEDLITLKLNARSNTIKHPMTDHERSILRKWQTGDNILYQHFVSKFKKQIETFGLSRMEKDLARLKEIRDKTVEECTIEPHNRRRKSQPFASPYRGGMNTFDVKNVTSEECKLMVTNEMTLVKKVYDSMKERWDKYLKRSEEHNALDYLRT